MRFPITIKLRRSRYFKTALLFVHGLAAFCLLSLPWFLWLPLLVLCAFSLHKSLKPSELTVIRLLGADRIEALMRTHTDAFPLRILLTTSVFLHLLVLHFQRGNEAKVHFLVLLPDHMAPEEFRVLRLWLRHQKSVLPQD